MFAIIFFSSISIFLNYDSTTLDISYMSFHSLRKFVLPASLFMIGRQEEMPIS